METKSLYISRAVSNFYGTEIKIWAGFRPVGNTETKFLGDYEQVLRAVFFMFSWANVFLILFKKNFASSKFNY